MFFTKEFVIDEISEVRKLVQKANTKSYIINSEKLHTILCKLDVIQNAVANVHTN